MVTAAAFVRPAVRAGRPAARRIVALPKADDRSPLPFADYRPPATGYRLPATGYRLPAHSYRLTAKRIRACSSPCLIFPVSLITWSFHVAP
ncbi:hypothetical protein SCALM49S_02538 [Streptomyces californicus]